MVLQGTVTGQPLLLMRENILFDAVTKKNDYSIDGGVSSKDFTKHPRKPILSRPTIARLAKDAKCWKETRTSTKTIFSYIRKEANE